MEYSIVRPDVDEIFLFLKDADQEYDSPLSNKLSLNDYAEKLHRYALTITCREETRIVAMLNCYVNRPPTAYISNICVTRAYQKKGIFRKMFSILCQECRRIGITEITLEVNHSNIKARCAYEKAGFELIEEGHSSSFLKFTL